VIEDVLEIIDKLITPDFIDLDKTPSSYAALKILGNIFLRES
jgi:hypothetical protein